MTTLRTWNRTGVWQFVRHYLEMVVAMVLGMVLLGPLESALLNPLGWAAVRGVPELEALIMASNMTVAMVVWMRHRGHGWGRTAEMVAGMSVPVVLACALWRVGLGDAVPALSDKALGTTVHVAMYAGMLLAMLYRFGDYAHAGPHAGGASA